MFHWALNFVLCHGLLTQLPKASEWPLNLGPLHSVAHRTNFVSCSVYVEDGKFTWLLNASKYARKCQRSLQLNKLWFSSSKCSKSSFHLFQNHLQYHHLHHQYFKIIIFIISLGIRISFELG